MTIVGELFKAKRQELNVSLKEAENATSIRSQKQAAEILGIDQPKISALIRGRLRSFSLERLIRFLNELGQDLSIMILIDH